MTTAHLRPAVLAFALLMERKLQENDFKGGWQEETPASLLQRLCEETDELAQEVQNASHRIWRDWDPAAHAAGRFPHRHVVVSYHPTIGWRCTDPDAPRRFKPTTEDSELIGAEAADVANFAMMIADVAGALDHREDTQEDALAHERAYAAQLANTIAEMEIERRAATAAAVNDALDRAAAALEDHAREGREWIPGSLWDTLTREAAGRIRALKAAP